MAISHMVLADYVTATASEKGSIRQDERAMKASWELGREIVQLAGKGFKFPSEFVGGLTAYVTGKYKL